MKLYEIVKSDKKNLSFSCIYLWTNLINDKHYVGQTQNFYNRMRQYYNGGANKYLKSAIEKYGLDKFDISVIEKCDIENLDNREQYWIDYYVCYEHDKGYNICQFASTTRGYKHTDETRALIQRIVKERAVHLYGELNGMYGKHHTKDALKAISESSKKLWENDEYRKMQHEKAAGENNYFYGKHFYGEENAMYGKHHSDETKKKISDAKRGKPSARAIKIKCVETGDIFNSYTAAAQWLNGYTSAVKLTIDNPNRTYRGYHFEKI